MTIKIATTGDKGGVGKTTTAVNLGDMLTESGAKVLLIDFDPRGDCATSLGLRPEPGVKDLFVSNKPGSAIIRRTSNPLLDVLPGNKTTEGALAYLKTMETSRSEIATQLLHITETRGAPIYNVIIFDAPPSADILRDVAVEMADIVLLPVKPEALGLAEVRDLIGRLQQRQRAVVLPVMYRPTNVHDAMLAQMDEWWPEHTGILIRVQTASTDLSNRILVVPNNKFPPEASAMRQTLRTYAPKDKTTGAYRRLAEEITRISLTVAGDD